MNILEMIIFICILILSVVLTYFYNYLKILIFFLKYLSILLILIIVIGIIYFYQISVPPTSTNIYTDIKLLVNIVEILGVISIVLAIGKYKSSKKQIKLSHTMKIMSNIQNNILPISSQNKFDEKIYKSEKICTNRIIDEASYDVFQSRLLHVKNSHLFINGKVKKDLYIYTRNQISSTLCSVAKFIVMDDAKKRVINEILVKLYRSTVYMDKGFTNNKFILKNLRNNVRTFLNNDDYEKYFSKKNKRMINYIRKIWKF